MIYKFGITVRGIEHNQSEFKEIIVTDKPYNEALEEVYEDAKSMVHFEISEIIVDSLTLEML